QEQGLGERGGEDGSRDAGRFGEKLRAEFGVFDHSRVKLRRLDREVQTTQRSVNGREVGPDRRWLDSDVRLGEGERGTGPLSGSSSLGGIRLRSTGVASLLPRWCETKLLDGQLQHVNQEALMVGPRPRRRR